VILVNQASLPDEKEGTEEALARYYWVVETKNHIQQQ
jgi:hypothetical protein